MRHLPTLAVLLVTACSPAAVAPAALVDATGRRPLDGDPLAGVTRHDALLDGRVRLVGVAAPTEVALGDRVAITLYFLVEQDCTGREPRVFVHAQVPGAEVNQSAADHVPLAGRVSAFEWRRGDLLVDRFELEIPAALAADALVVTAGLYEGKTRWQVAPASAHDGTNRVPVARFAVTGAPPLLVQAVAPKRRVPIVLDGVLDEADWQRAPRLGPFRSYDGKSAITRATHARVLWDAENLWLAFEVDDPDVFTVYAQRDDPLYESEAVELFVDADGDRDAYVELQAAADDVQFDAAFVGGRRKNMRKAWNAGFQTKTRRSDVGFTSEWRVPVADLEDVPADEPRAGAVWRINLFRLERVRREGRVVRTEASAWSSPLSGDFHNLDRFGALRFVDDDPPR